MTNPKRTARRNTKTLEAVLSEPSLESLKPQFRRLRLTAAYDRLVELCGDIEGSKLSTVRVIKEVFDYEVLRRDTNALTRRLQEAKMTLADARPQGINYEVKRGLSKSQMEALLTLEWMEKRQNVIITGATGCGKTYIACALTAQACIRGKTARVIRVPLLLTQMAMSHQIAESYFKQLREIKKVDLLVLDDWGIGQLDARSREDLLEIINERYMCGSTIVTSVLPVNCWSQYIDDPTMSDAILDRLVSVAHRIDLDGPSMRQRKEYGGVQTAEESKEAKE